MLSTLFIPDDLPALPSPDPIARALFEAPLLPAIALAILGVLAFFTLRASGKPTAALVSLAVGVLGAGALVASAALVTTDREHVMRAADRLIAATAQADEAALARTLTIDASVRSRFASVEGRDAIIGLSQRRVAPMVEDHAIKGVEVEMRGPRVARSHITVRVDGAYGPNLSVWEVDWQRPEPDSTVWSASRITPIWIRGVSDPAGN